VAEVADVDDDLQQQADDQAVAGRQVELVLSVISPAGQQAGSARHQQADRQGDEHGGFDDSLDDDYLDEGVVLASHAAELGPQSRPVMWALRGDLIHGGDLNNLGWPRRPLCLSSAAVCRLGEGTCREAGRAPGLGV